ncbi:hypothetical protein VNO80_25823 [Phaseolus coccineus]|uniref:Bulb-type lectin domain-containing protein n=1 Tax=Phaseolus coccineus TaxID=3886 RepID=A0AAN9LVC2_PHACN
MCLCLWWSTCFHVEATNDSLKPGDTLNYTDTLCSKKGIYCLGFNSMISSENEYLLVFSVNNYKLVWISDVNQPVDGDSAVLSLNRSGVLKIESERGKPIILYSPPQAINNTKATFIVSNGDEDTFSFTSTSEEPDLQWTLTEIGQISDDEGYVARADLCYGYNTDGGCQRWQDIPKCRNPGDVFQKKTGHINYPNVSFEGNVSYGYSDCEASCWSNCTCSGFNELYSNGTGCMFFHWISADNYTSDSTGDNFYLLVNMLTNHKGTKKWTWIGAVAATALLAICLFTICLALKKRKFVFQEKKMQGMVTKMVHLATCSRSSAMEDFEVDLKKGNGLKLFNYTSLMAATNGFSSENKLGQGGFGPVYKTQAMHVTCRTPNLKLKLEIRFRMAFFHVLLPNVLRNVHSKPQSVAQLNTLKFQEGHSFLVQNSKAKVGVLSSEACNKIWNDPPSCLLIISKFEACYQA